MLPFSLLRHVPKGVKGSRVRPLLPILPSVFFSGTRSIMDGFEHKMGQTQLGAKQCQSTHLTIKKPLDRRETLLAIDTALDPLPFIVGIDGENDGRHVVVAPYGV